MVVVEGGGKAGSWLRLPLRGAVYNSRMWDSQKETPNRTSCGCKIPRCQELKITALESQPPRGGGEGACSLWGRGGRPEVCSQPSHLWMSSCHASDLPPLVALQRPPDPPLCVGTHPKLPTCQPSLCLQRVCAVCSGPLARGRRRT